EEFQTLVDKAHGKGIRVLMDVVLNHTGPVTDLDPQWPDEWVRTGPVCSYQDQETAVTCTLTSNLPDIRTESKEEVDLPPALIEKWKKENRYESEIRELEDFFTDSGLKRTPANYIIKWITDYARETGIDGFRIDTVKHVEEDVWETLNEQAQIAFDEWKQGREETLLHDDPFFIIGELYGYEIQDGRDFYFSSGNVDYFDYGYDAMINFAFKRDAGLPYDQLFNKYETFRDSLNAQAGGQQLAFMNYISSHDDGQPYDANRENSMESATKLMLTPGMAQIYYGDETARKLNVEDAVGDAKLRSMMDWNTLDVDVLEHWKKLGSFRRNHPAVGAGKLNPVQEVQSGSLTLRTYRGDDYEDAIIVGAGLPDGNTSIKVPDSMSSNKKLKNAYTGEVVSIADQTASFNVVNGVLLIEVVDR
ncbi:MAG: alpha-amylase family glycosyl hydrolase, partial [Nonlabens sp.]